MRHLRTVTALLAALLLATLPAAAQDAGPASPDAGAAEGAADTPFIQVNGEDDDSPVDIIAKLPPDVRQRLTGEQIAQIVNEQQKNERSNGGAVAIVVPLGFFAMSIGIVLVILLVDLRRKKLLHETLRVMIEKGAAIPPELLEPKTPKNDRRRGIVLVAVGLSLSLALYLDGDKSWGFGLVPLAIGAGYLISWVLEKKNPAA
jgi:hypothetical protein